MTRGPKPSSGEKYIKLCRGRWYVSIRNRERQVSRGLDSFEAAVEMREWLLQGTGKDCRTTQDTYAHPDGLRFLLA